MIISVKRKGFRSKRAMLLTLVVLLSGFVAYYEHMGAKKLPKTKHEDKIIIKKVPIPKKVIKIRKIRKVKKAKVVKKARRVRRIIKARKRRNKTEDLIYAEAKTAVSLVGQKYIQKVKIFDNRLLIICDPRANIKPLMIRYGALALIRSTINNIQIAVDLKKMVEDKHGKK